MPRRPPPPPFGRPPSVGRVVAVIASDGRIEPLTLAAPPGRVIASDGRIEPLTERPALPGRGGAASVPMSIGTVELSCCCSSETATKPVPSGSSRSTTMSMSRRCALRPSPVATSFIIAGRSICPSLRRSASLKSSSVRSARLRISSSSCGASRSGDAEPIEAAARVACICWLNASMSAFCLAMASAACLT